MKILCILISVIFFWGCNDNSIINETEVIIEPTIDSNMNFLEIIKVDSIDVITEKDIRIREFMDTTVCFKFLVNEQKLIRITDTLLLIEDLFRTENDNRIHSKLVSSFVLPPNAAQSDLGYTSYSDKDKINSIQVYSLYFLCRFLFPSYYTNIAPILVDRETKQTATFDGHIVNKAWEIVNLWKKRLDETSLYFMLDNNDVPLSDTGAVIFWKND